MPKAKAETPNQEEIRALVLEELGEEISGTVEETYVAPVPTELAGRPWKFSTRGVSRAHRIHKFKLDLGSLAHAGSMSLTDQIELMLRVVWVGFLHYEADLKFEDVEEMEDLPENMGAIAMNAALGYVEEMFRGVKGGTERAPLPPVNGAQETEGEEG